MKFLVIVLAAALIGFAEFGDKTQLTTITLSCKYPPKKVFWGAFSAFLILSALAVTVGTLIFELIPAVWLKIVVGLFFIIFGIYSLLTAKNQEEISDKQRQGNPFAVAFSLIFLNELGDKTQLLTIALAAKYKAPFEVFLGALIGLSTIALISTMLGKVIAKYVKDTTIIHRLAGIIFIVLGLLTFL
ncbi:MAG: TMEM165/GDT1 family protein [Actinobacteria bacterium]|nr:MAG: TMEM165/GDT1 family protein [Actinomycetota bacterium]